MEGRPTSLRISPAVDLVRPSCNNEGGLPLFNLVLCCALILSMATAAWNYPRDSCTPIPFPRLSVGSLDLFVSSRVFSMLSFSCLIESLRESLPLCTTLVDELVTDYQLPFVLCNFCFISTFSSRQTSALLLFLWAHFFFSFLFFRF